MKQKEDKQFLNTVPDTFLRAGKTARQLRVLTVLPQNPSSILRTDQAAHNPLLAPVSGDPASFSVLCMSRYASGVQLYIRHIYVGNIYVKHIWMQNIHAHMIHTHMTKIQIKR